MIVAWVFIFIYFETESLYLKEVINTSRNIPGTHFFKTLSRPQSHSAAGMIMSFEKSNDVIPNRTRDLPACSIVPQPTTLFEEKLTLPVDSLATGQTSGLEWISRSPEVSIKKSQVKVYWDISNDQFRQHRHRFVSSCGAHQRGPYLLGQPDGGRRWRGEKFLTHVYDRKF
jgi:hypothetical protein